MKPSFHARALNGPFDDPCVYVRVLREGRAFLSDLGFTTALSPRDILKTEAIFVSHAHVDHFIGFDNVLRVSLKKEGPLKLYGPRGFIDCIDGKLRGYTWNLIESYPLALEVSEIEGLSMERAIFRADNVFACQPLGSGTFDGTLMQDTSCCASAVILDHQVPCLGFCIKEDYHINIDRARLRERGLPVGPWLGAFKTAMRENQTEAMFSVGGQKMSFSELHGIATKERGQKVCYVVDAIGSDANISRIIDFVRGADTLFIETYYLHKDKKTAMDRYHLTAREAGIIAREAGVGRLEPIHFSPRYMDDPDALIGEAREEYER